MYLANKMEKKRLQKGGEKPRMTSY